MLSQQKAKLTLERNKSILFYLQRRFEINGPIVLFVSSNYEKFIEKRK